MKLLKSFRTTVFLLICFSIYLAAATIVEKFTDRETVVRFFYHSPLMFIFCGALALNFVFIFIGQGYMKSRRISLAAVHSGFLLIMAGACMTFAGGKEGYVHLREGESVAHMITDKGGREQLPFTITLDDFSVERYPGSNSPSSFESYVTITSGENVSKEKIYMNNILKKDGYRLYQASFDKDEKGSILAVSKDVAGNAVTYSGYFLLFAGLILSFVDRNSTIRRLFRKLHSKPGTVSAAALALLLLPGMAADAATADISREHAERFGHIPVQMSGRIMPMSTFASEAVRKIHKDDNIEGLSPEQFIIGVWTFPEEWLEKKFIEVPGAGVKMKFALDDYCSYRDLFDGDGNYLPAEDLAKCYAKPVTSRTGYDKDLIKLDERVNILQLLIMRRLPAIFPLPDDPELKWHGPGENIPASSSEKFSETAYLVGQYVTAVRSAASGKAEWEKADAAVSMIEKYQVENSGRITIDSRKLRTETFYNRADIFSKCRNLYLILGALSLLLSFIRKEKAGKVVLAACAVVFAAHTAGIGIRWYISGHAPWSNAYETMVCVSWAAVLCGLLFIRRNTSATAIAVVCGGIFLFVSGLNWMDPQISPLVPVLKSPWLMLHVAVIVGAYGFFGVSFLIGTTCSGIRIFRRRDSLPERMLAELGTINEITMWTGLVLMTAGTFIGAIWANESWGRYWGWDPKETWALVTVLVYTIATHSHLLKFKDRQKAVEIMSVLAFLSVLMTFFGVNMLLGGMHSYA